MIYSVDQYSVYRLHNADMSIIKVVPAIETDADYQAMQIWRQSNDLMQYHAESYKPPLLDYKAQAKQMLANKADAFVDRITTASGIPKSEVANFETKAQAALAYVYQGVPIPPYSAIYQEASVTGEAIDDLCAKIIERVQQKEWVNGQISGMRRSAGWAIDAALTHDAVDAAVDAVIAQAKAVFAGFVV